MQQARSAIGLPRSSKENDKQLKAILSTVAGGQLRLSWLWRSLVVGERRGLDAASIGVVAVIASPASTVGCAKEAVDWTPGGPRRHGPCPYYSAANALNPTAEARASAVLSKLPLVLRIPSWLLEKKENLSNPRVEPFIMQPMRPNRNSELDHCAELTGMSMRL